VIDRRGLPQLLQRLRQLFEDDRRQAPRRLVEDEDFRLHHQRTADCQHLLFAARQRLRERALALLHFQALNAL
jgi:hypothetical protein